ncbi:xanthine dehydrogenase family protein molybdopterin-binding subunit [Catalinimonas niigatensis]|uniref:xanthine dehydrogenase family protein molybdopterin-binding subunit n=1 Tax=Catalinimonas niigatensis TaxID=1397264 RepID=UPI0026652762|nr:xanthine dehydrogenase family protein molybdopterin-binding subunit [Catalinimonas niigatensis]WPP50026.1 xanthine dehydrogenase family protein molybdopterin-binding subunit [Catalinimonas niigatensis]
MTTDYIGKPRNRVDGRAKVTGTAKYAAEFNTPGLLHGVVISSTIAKGKIKSIHTEEALKLKGVHQVFTHENTPKQAWLDLSYKDMVAPPGSPFRPLHNNKIQFSMQPIGLVVAETLELARYAAMLVKVVYEEESHNTKLEDNLDKSIGGKYKFRAGFEPPSSRGHFEKAYEAAEVKLDVEYFHGAEHHNPMEMHASTVVYEEDGSLTIYDKTQGAINSRHYVTWAFGLSNKKVRVLSPFVGGAFGSALRPQYQLFMAVLAALQLKRSVKVELSRPQMFSFGHRPVTLQKLSLGASADGSLQAIRHAAYSETSQFENYAENIVNWSGKLYKCEHVEEVYRLVKLDMYTPLDMRAPGGVTGVYALESAMDELAYQLKMDPVQLRLKNYTDEDMSKGKPFSSKALRQCYEEGAERFGWAKRNPEPRSMKEGHNLIGWGMATGIWDAMQTPARAHAIFTADGKLTVSSATADIGTGTYTIMTQIAAETLGLPMENVEFKLGDSSMPFAFVEGGSTTAASVGTAVKYVCDKIAKKLLKEAAKMEASPFKDAKMEDVDFADGHISRKDNPALSVPITNVMWQRKISAIQKDTTALPDMLKQNKYARNTHSAVFVEVKVDEELGTIKVSRVVSAIAGGRILNAKTAHSQILGGVVWGISMALEEDTFMDHQFGRFMNHNLAEYHVAVNADIQDIDVIFVKEEDTVASPIGVKGLGEIGIVGVAAAIGNAIYHATGKRIRDLPMTPDKAMR